MNYRLAIFDLDGTILNTLHDLAASTNAALTALGYPTRSVDEVRRFVGNGIRLLIERAVPAGTPTAQTDEVYRCFMAHYAQHCADTTRPYDGIPELLRALRAAGCRTAVVSNKADSAVQPLCRRYFDGLFDAAVGERPGVRKKPAPDSVNEILRQLAIPRTQAVYIGDSDVDIHTAQNAQMDCISVDWGFRSRAFLVENGASRIVSTPQALQALILGDGAHEPDSPSCF